MTSLPPQSALRELLDYDPDTGVITWAERADRHFAHTQDPVGRRISWNKRWAGKEAFGYSDRGYRQGSLLGLNARAHRVIWKWMTGDEPVQIDHINGDRGDNRWSNLRGVSSAENLRNTARRSDNSSGVTGVSWNKERQKWFAYIRDGGKMMPLGRFPTLEEATDARRKAELELGYHPNHGRR